MLSYSIVSQLWHTYLGGSHQTHWWMFKSVLIPRSRKVINLHISWYATFNELID